MVLVTCAIVLILAIMLEIRKGLPLGLTCMLAAFILCAAVYHMPATQVIVQFFPSQIVMPLMLAIAFFSVFTTNGTSQILARAILALIKGNMRLYPWLLFALCTPLYILLDGIALRYIIAPLVFSIAKAGNGSTAMAVSTAYLPFVAGSLNPYIGVDAATRSGILSDLGLKNTGGINLAVWLNTLLLICLLQLCVYLLTKSYKLRDFAFSGISEQIRFTPQQIRSLVILACTAVAFLAPPVIAALVSHPLAAAIVSLCNTYTVFVAGILALILSGVCDWSGIVSRVSVRPIIMIVGVTFLLKTAQLAGLEELCAAAASHVPHVLVAPVLLLISALLSFFVSAGVILPMMYSMAAALAINPAQAIVYITCATVGAAISGISPISNSGIAFLSTVEPADQTRYSACMFKYALAAPVFMALLSASGLLDFLSSFFAGWYY